MAEETRKRLLARRARFIAAALAAAGVGSADCGTSQPEPCLAPIYDGSAEDVKSTDGSTDATSKDATTDASDDGGLEIDGDAGPLPCLVPPLPDN